jgi:hypothetical protein
VTFLNGRNGDISIWWTQLRGAILESQPDLLREGGLNRPRFSKTLVFESDSGVVVTFVPKVPI